MTVNRFIRAVYKLISNNMLPYFSFFHGTVRTIMKLRFLYKIILLVTSFSMITAVTSSSAFASVVNGSSPTTPASKMLIVGPIYKDPANYVTSQSPLKYLSHGQESLYRDQNITIMKGRVAKTTVKNFVGSSSCTAISVAAGTSSISASLYHGFGKANRKPSLDEHLLTEQVTTTVPINPALTTTTTTTTAATTTTTTTAATTTTTTSSSVTSADLPVIPTTTTANLDSTAVASPDLYDLFLTNGSIHNLGGASFYGSPIHKKTKYPIMAMASTAYGAGYLLATTKGNIYNFGEAHFYGSPIHRKIRQPLVSLAATPDGKGYWLADANGAIYNYGDAPFCGSLVHAKLKSPIASLAATPDGKGYWLVTATGDVYSFGDALNLRSPAPVRLPSPIVSLAATPDGKGYWLVTAKGNIYNTGDAKFYGSPIHKHFTRPVVSITATADGKGYYITTAKGQIFNYGDALFHGSLVHKKLSKKIFVAGLIIQGTPLPVTPSPTPAPSLGPSPFRAGISGYDISNFQCSTPGASTLGNNLPSSSPFSIIEAAGWLDNADNPCLRAEVNWANTAEGSSGDPYNLYLFMNSPENTPAIINSSDSGPGGNCPSLSSQLQAACVAYNYGYNGAEQAFTYATSQGAKANVWWLDIENAQLSKTNYSDFPTNYWSQSTILNDETLQGAIDALRSNQITVGIYSTSVQYSTITGNYTPSAPQIPLWIAGAPWTSPPYSESGLPGISALNTWCQGSAAYNLPKVTYNELFAGGTPWLLQETPGTEVSPYNLDPDFAC